MEIPRADISASASIDRSLVWNFHMSWAATDVPDWLSPQRCINTAANDQSFISYYSSRLLVLWQIK